MGRILAVDYGEKKLGIALSDETKKIAIIKQPIPTGEIALLLDCIERNEVEEIILGFPKSLSGGETAAAVKVRRFASWLEKSISIPVHLADERFTTRQAVEKLRLSGVKGRALRKQVDSMSAYILLESYLKKFRN